MSDFLRYDQDGPIVTLTMDQPELRNVLTGNSAADEFVAACERITADQSVRVVILTGNGPAFSSGGNVRNMQKYFVDDIDPALIRHEYRTGIQRLALAVFNLEVPTIAAVNGPAIGAGCDLACMCDMRIAAEEAVFAESFVKVGIVPGDGGAWLLPRAVGQARAAEMAFTGDSIDAATALEYGLVSRVVPAAELLPTARALAGRVAANPGQVLRMTKRLMREAQTTRFETLLEMSAGFQAVAHKTAHHREAVTAFIEKRRPDFAD
ncbi:crotonase/enoyl-CoA hydratase family protein [Zoogloea sp.]|uniref:crotonase/enoyl-CoA hydratase family protein n=1 Tax=Zoogloea sp. TaxID=49181 RepID=UPI0035B1D2F9